MKKQPMGTGLGSVVPMAFAKDIDGVLTSNSSALIFSIPNRLAMSISISCPRQFQREMGDEGRAVSGNMLVVPYKSSTGRAKRTHQCPRNPFVRLALFARRRVLRGGKYPRNNPSVSLK